MDGTPLASSSGLLASSLQAPEWKGSCCDPDAGEAELGGVQPALVAGTMLVLSQTPDAFVPTSPVGWAWGAFGLLVLAGAVGVWWLRRRDAREDDPEPAELVSPDGDFASPEGVLPGHAGVVRTGEAGPVDLAATMLDLAVRNYLWVTAEDADWRLTRRNPADEHLNANGHRCIAQYLDAKRDSLFK